MTSIPAVQTNPQSRPLSLPEMDLQVVDELLRALPQRTKSEHKDTLTILRYRLKSILFQLGRATLPTQQASLAALHRLYAEHGGVWRQADGKTFRLLVEGVQELEESLLRQGEGVDANTSYTRRVGIDETLKDIWRNSPSQDLRSRAATKLRFTASIPMPPAPPLPVRKEKVPQSTLQALGVPDGIALNRMWDEHGKEFDVSNARAQGGYGKFRVAISRHGNLYAVKEFRTEEAGSKDGVNKHNHRHTRVTLRANVEQEIKSLGELSNHIRVKRVMNWRGKVYVLMTLMNGELAEALEALPEDKRACLARSSLTQMAHALYLMHQKGVVHGDVKLHNALWDAEGHVALADFGFALPLEADGLVHHTSRGTYMPPEMLDTNSWHTTADTWSLGACIADAFAEGKNPLFFIRDTDNEGNELHLSVPKTSERMHLFAAWRERLLNDEGHVVISRLPGDPIFSQYFVEFAQKDPDLCAYVLERMLDPDPDRRARMDEVWAFAQELQTDEDVRTAQHALVEMANHAPITPVVQALQRYHQNRSAPPEPEPEPQPGPIWPLPQRRWPWQR